jgi:hypothetical protein
VGGPTTHIEAPDGTRRSIGPGTIATPTGGTIQVPRSLAPATGDSFWMAPWAPYRLERWNARGELEFVLERQVDHLPHREYEVTWESGRLRTTFPILSAVGEDSEGRLWTAVAVELDSGGGALPPRGRRFESIIEVLDPRTGDLLGTGRVRGLVRGIHPDGRIVAHGEGDVGEPLLFVTQARLEGVPPGSPLP